MDHEAAFEASRAMDASAAERAERLRRSGNPAAAARLAQAALGHGDDVALRTALALALLDLGEPEEARHTLEMLLDALAGDGGFASADRHEPHAAMIPDTTIAEATAATLELVGNLDDASFELALASAEAERALMRDADDVAEQVLRELPAEPPDELLPSTDSPFATRTFADLLQRQGHESEAESLRSTLARRELTPVAAEPPAADVAPPQSDPDRVLETLHRWLHNLGRNAA